jgi:uroporphyrinogen decarboxylase
LTRLGNDAICVAACYQSDRPIEEIGDGLFRNEWGMVLKKFGLYNEFYGFPLAHAETKDHIDSYDFPDPLGSGRYDIAKHNIEKYASDYGLIGNLECAFFETAWYLTGMEKLLTDLLVEPEYLHPLLDRILQINTEVGRQLIKLGIDMIWCGDDFGSQRGMIMDPDLWRRIIKPKIKWMFEEFRAVNPEIKIAWHSCGSIIPIIPDFIEIGLDVLNPIQPMAKGMDPHFLKSEYGNDLVFFGGICEQDLLPNGNPQQIKDEIKRRVSILGNGGGYIVAPAHHIQDDTPVENTMAIFEAVREI